MARHRLGVALLFDAGVTGEINGLRRALGEPDIGKIPPHLTLAPPINTRDLAEAERVVRAGAAASHPMVLELGPVATFLPDNPVAYLQVNGDIERLHQLRDAIFVPPFERDLTWPYVPHVTIADGIDPPRIAAAPAVLASFREIVKVRAVYLLEEQGQVWAPIAGFQLGPPAVIGRGGQPIELDVVEGEMSVNIIARRDGEAVGRATAWRRATHAWLRRLVVAESERSEGVGGHLLAAVQSWAADRGATVIEFDLGVDVDAAAEAFLRRHGWQPGPGRLQRRL